jgi:hypothetical protein
MNSSDVAGSNWKRNGLRRPNAHTSRSFAFDDVANGLFGGVISARDAVPAPSGRRETSSRRITPRSVVVSCAAHAVASSPRLAYSIPSGPNRTVPPLWLPASSGASLIRS